MVSRILNQTHIEYVIIECLHFWCSGIFSSPYPKTWGKVRVGLNKSLSIAISFFNKNGDEVSAISNTWSAIAKEFKV